MKVSMIVAASENDVIGVNGNIPWYIPNDFRYFKQTTSGKPIIMGRKTWDSLPKKPLPKRENIVITRREGFEAEGAHVCHNIDDALMLARRIGADEIFIIGGEQIYSAALDTGLVDRVYLTRIRAEYEGDTFFPTDKLKDWNMKEGELQGEELKYSFDIYERE